MLQCMKEILMLTCLNLVIKKTDRHESNLYWMNTIKYTIQWFPYLNILEHNANNIKPNKGIIFSLLKVFVMFGLRLFDDRYKVEAITIRCTYCKKETGLYLGTSTL